LALSEAYTYQLIINPFSMSWLDYKVSLDEMEVFYFTDLF